MFRKILLKSGLPENIDIFVKGFPKLHWINPYFSLHSLFHMIFSLTLLIASIKRTDALIVLLFWVVPYLIIVKPFSPSVGFTWLKFHCADFTFTEMPVIDWRYFMD